MNFKQLAISFLFGSFLLTSCGAWTDEDKKNFMDFCQKEESDKEYCECTLGKLMNEFDSFEEIRADQTAFAEALSSEECLGLEEK